MRIRVLWVMAYDGHDWNLFFFRRFSNVENHVKRNQRCQYVPVPNNDVILKLIVEKLRLATSFMKYVEGRDNCNKDCLSPVFEIPVSKTHNLSAIMLPKKNAIFSCVPFFERNEINSSVATDPITAVALNLLSGMAECLSPLPEFLTKDHVTGSLLDNFISQCMPLGRPIDTSFSVTLDKLLNKPLAAQNTKQVAWKPIYYKGKGLVTLTVTEYVRSHQYDRPENVDVVSAYGSIVCNAKLEGDSPELLLTITNENPNSKLSIVDLSVDSCVSSVDPVEHKTGAVNLSYCKLRCMPPSHDFKLCNYVVPVVTNRPPVLGVLKLRGCSNSDLLLQLKLDETFKNSFEFFEVRIPFLEREPISSAELQPTWGMANVTPDKRSIFWNLGTKFPSKTLQVSLSATINFGAAKKSDHGFNAPQNELDKQLNFAQIKFCAKSFLLSSSYIDSKSVYTAPASKFKFSLEKELLSTEYKIWNSCSDSPAATQQ